MGMQTNAIEAVVAWMDAMRRGDLDAAADWFHPDVTWTGVPAGAECRNRAEVLDMLRNSLPARGAEAVELIAPSADTVVLGAKVPGLAEVGGEPLEGQLFNVFRVREGRIIAVVDYALRDDALQAAGATSPAWR
jgi:ketosteroid isomerase-like protein